MSEPREFVLVAMKPRIDRKDVMADEIANMMCDLTDAVSHKVKLTDQEQDELWELLLPGMEKFFNYPDYRNYN